MNSLRSLVPMVAFVPLLAGCAGGDVALRPQDNALLVSPSSVSLSASSPSAVAFGVADSATGAGTITISEGTCNGIASFGGNGIVSGGGSGGGGTVGLGGGGVGIDSAGARTMTVGSNPGVNPGGASGYSISPVAPGTCTLRLNDSLNHVATIFVTVTK